jgi:hypothetical protein
VTDSISTTIAAIALAVSLIVFFDNRMRQGQAARLARQPALVLAWDPDRSTWTLHNIGRGPALDVVMLQRIDGEWRHPVRMPEMPVDGVQTVPRRWYEGWSLNPGLGARYRSITGEEYQTLTADDYSRITDGWRELTSRSSEIEPHWLYRRGESDR